MVEYFSSGISNLLFGIGWALGLGVGAHLYSQHRITIGAVFLIVSYISMLAGPLDSLRKQASNLQRSTAGIGRIAALFHQQPTVRAGGQEALPSGALAVHFDGVSFAYADEEPLSTETRPVASTVATSGNVFVTGKNIPQKPASKSKQSQG